MHPKIKEFWETRVKASIYFDGYYYFQCVDQDAGTLIVRARSWKSESSGYTTSYFCDGSYRSENEMLKIIKLKAFL